MDCMGWADHNARCEEVERVELTWAGSRLDKKGPTERQSVGDGP